MAELLPLHNIQHKKIRTVGVLKVEKIGGTDRCILVNVLPMDRSFHMQSLVVVHHIFCMIEIDLDTEIIFVIEIISDAVIILRNSRSFLEHSFKSRTIIRGSPVNGKIV